MSDAFLAPGNAFSDPGNAFPASGDAFGGKFTMFPTPAEQPRLLALKHRDPAYFARILSTFASRGSSAARAELHAAEAPERLLDSSSPLSPEDIRRQGALYAPPNTVASDGRAPWEIMGRFWPLLAACSGSATPRLVSLSLTVPGRADVHVYAAAFASSVLLQSPAGAFMVVDIGAKDGKHIHGLALVTDLAGIHAEWCRITGGRTDLSRLTPVTGWEKHVRGQYGKLLRNVAGVLDYAFKPLPPEYGHRRPREDVIAAGVFVPLWKDVLAALERDSTDAEGVWQAVGAVEPTRPTCARCGQVMPKRKRRHAQWCSASCRNAAWKARVKDQCAKLLEPEAPAPHRPPSSP